MHAWFCTLVPWGFRMNQSWKEIPESMLTGKALERTPSVCPSPASVFLEISNLLTPLSTSVTVLENKCCMSSNMVECYTGLSGRCGPVTSVACPYLLGLCRNRHGETLLGWATESSAWGISTRWRLSIQRSVTHCFRLGSPPSLHVQILKAVCSGFWTAA